MTRKEREIYFLGIITGLILFNVFADIIVIIRG